MRRTPPSSWLPGLVVGTIAAAATSGTLIGFGARDGTPARPFNAVAGAVLGPRADGVWGFDAAITLTGALLHVTLVLACGVVLVTIASERPTWRRGWRLVLLAIVVALSHLLLDLVVAAPRLHAGLADVLVPGQLIALHLLLAAALVVGMRLAHGTLRSD